MKALILSGGKGTRLRPLTYTGAKQLVPVANKPILWYGIELIVAAGITDIGIIVSPETGEEVKAKTGNGDRFGAKITYILQEKPAGLAHAVKIAQPFLGDSPFIMYLGDNLIESKLNPFLETFNNNKLDALIMLRQVANPTAFGVATVDEKGRVLQLVEKPKVPPSNLALVGVYFFAPTIHEAIAQIQPSARGELEITDAIQQLINQQKKVEASNLEGWWLDTGKKDDLLSANQIILDSCIVASTELKVDAKSQIIGRVQIGKSSEIINCTVRGPVVIGENCHIENCFIGPYSSIADRVTMLDADIEHSVILEGAKISGIEQRIVDSVIGQRAQLTNAPIRPKALRFMIGDDSQIELV
ncbi:MAG: glucose-1-phosphate thymidylyltransferase [Oscillatoriales cyanobacterium]|uniref:Glucose-1-phosphate thymidylyltransferase n=1 Tax=Microcoleus anatoxicus PTRS2 TaxID=2705321 RepID=A0ABU8YJB9_9CYAN|nr:MAG: glucose-1-phosphate thymidylyltransferase [Oscillatoriales cyanobacterium]TAD97150.1 MAG: glucose-1-phosphate thymidylyltransferase [Oscillatoriales cyanobacterium]TAE04504.1 MAG: glucose-1-phosphate thymidylyltransferase [Oscillatoriales cyanobacterium]TAF04938.1 MAG: glucose-1-phosphate thymidylyltransferase [Oscillatoriales cyanobacterium]TAF46884.1 MAG: glucose-1-phosphate thymidylyltransferase [Oscillatoriales cyanobacterium]